ncbi:LysR family transcriptional regulator [Acidovorax sp. CCYZU-2555]|nr:LysR family transcriptional regulator [Acidovorax sp. CCYZU-2555]
MLRDAGQLGEPQRVHRREVDGPTRVSGKCLLGTVLSGHHETGSFQRAGQRARLTPSAVTKVIRKREDEFGAQWPGVQEACRATGLRLRHATGSVLSTCNCLDAQLLAFHTGPLGLTHPLPADPSLSRSKA